MTSVFVVLAAFAAILWVNWYFLLGSKPSAKARPIQGAAKGGAVQEVLITVQGGYSPSVVLAEKGVPVRLIFDRKEKSPCSDELILSKAGIRRFLPPFAKTAIEFTPAESGSYEFTCGMNMLRGRVEVKG